MSGEFLDLVESFNLLKSVKGVSDFKGLILDLVLSSGFCPENVDLGGVFVSDHNAEHI